MIFGRWGRGTIEYKFVIHGGSRRKRDSTLVKCVRMTNESLAGPARMTAGDVALPKKPMSVG